MLLRDASRDGNKRDVVVAAPEGGDTVSRCICRRGDYTVAAIQDDFE
jgi:hypothetical protein